MREEERVPQSVIIQDNYFTSPPPSMPLFHILTQGLFDKEDSFSQQIAQVHSGMCVE